ncbi:MAG: large ribosomal subunit protein bL35 [Minisyncoccales bacterium]
MKKAKIRKSILKRFKITKTGKILRRKTGQDHYRAKKTGKEIRKRKKLVPLSQQEIKIIKRFLYYSGKRK